MLQQTRVETVLPYYSAWLERWPSLSQLATATEQQVLKQWEGLGYYSRALNMLKCAQQCVYEQGQTELPQNSSALRKLPGIGEYISAAVASISSNEAILALDTNVKRIFSRLYQEQPNPTSIKAWQKTAPTGVGALCLAWQCQCFTHSTGATLMQSKQTLVRCLSVRIYLFCCKPNGQRELGRIP